MQYAGVFVENKHLQPSLTFGLYVTILKVKALSLIFKVKTGDYPGFRASNELG
jgi:hypothetical protein